MGYYVEVESKVPIKLVIFDLSGVMFSNEEPPFLERFANEHHLPREKFLARYDELVQKSEKGEITGIGLWQTLLAEFGVPGNPATIIAEMIDCKESYPDMLAVAKKLKEQHAVVYLSNYNGDYWKLIAAKFDFDEWFSWGVVSYQIGFRKPAKEGFLYILKKADCRPEQAVFIDDSPKNLEEAAKTGIAALLFRNKESLLADLRLLHIEI